MYSLLSRFFPSERDGYFFLFLLIFLTSCAQQHHVVIRDVDVFDGEKIHRSVDFIFADSLIVAISTRKKRYRNAAVIEGEGRTILPPLLNAHVHVRTADNLKDALNAGIFGLLDMFTTDRRANYLRKFNDSLSYARYFSSNVGATVPGGHGTQYGVSIPVIDRTLSGREFVRDRIGQKADYIKITQEYSMAKLSPDQILDITGEARKHGKKVVGHISALEDALTLARGDVHGLAHIWYRKGSVSRPKDLSLLADRGVFLIPTLSVIEKAIDRAKEIDVEDEYLSFALVQKEVRKAYEVGITILAGTDAPNYGMNYTEQLYEELILLKNCGIPPEEVLKMATTNIYDRFDLPDFSSLEKGSVASFLLVEGHPYERIEDLKNRKRIWKEGQEIRLPSPL